MQLAQPLKEAVADLYRDDTNNKTIRYNEQKISIDLSEKNRNIRP